MQVLQQFELLKTNLLTLGARRLLALAVAATIVVGIVGAIGLYASRPETEPLYAGLTQADVARIGTALHEAGIPYDVSSDGTRVLVRRAQAPTARMLLAERGLPAGATSGYELFDKLGPFGLTSFMQDVTRARALEGELIRTIQTMKGITSARVHVVVPPSGSFRRSQQPTSASVVIRIEGARSQATAQVIRHLVSAAVPGLSPENVTVMSTDGSMLAAGGDSSILASAKMIELEQALARQTQDNIRRALAPYLGVENFEVTVATRINLDKRQLSEQVYDPESKSERSARVVKEQGSSQNSGNRQAVTVEQNLPAEAGAALGGDQSRKTNERREEVNNYELSSKSLTTVSEGHRIESLHVSLVVNRKRIVAANGGANPDAQVKEIEAIAAAAAGLDRKRGDKISVVAVEFQDVATDAPGKASVLERLAVHLDTLIISVTAIAALLILVWLGLLPSVRTIMALQADTKQTPQLVAQTTTTMLPGPEGTPRIAPNAKPASGLTASKVDPVKSKLAGLIEQDEKQVAEILKQWLIKA